MRRPAGPVVAVLAALALLLGLAGCGSDDDGAGSTSGAAATRPELTVFAAASLTDAIGDYARAFGPARVRTSFAGSDQLAAQIRQGLAPDVFASANTTLPDALYGEGLVERPVTFAQNRLVLAVPTGSTKVRSLDDLRSSDVRLAIGSASVPVGAYTRKVLARLPDGQGKAILARAASQEPDVKGVVGKLVEGAVDAGFVYVTDVRAASGKLRAIELPAALKPTGAYGVAVVKGTRHPAQARAFVQGLLRGAGAQALRARGFEPPPS